MTDYSQQTGKGIAFGVAAYVWWGFAVIYFKLVAHVQATEILAHRIIWSVLFLTILLALKKQIVPAFAALKDKKTHLYLAFSTILIAANWLTFIWAVGHSRILDTSLGYFINPLVNVLLGGIFLKERLRKMQIVCVLLAVAGVTIQTIGYGHLPMISLGLAFSFGFYGLLRKKTPLPGLSGLAAETTLLLPMAIGYLLYVSFHDSMSFMHVNLKTDLLLLSAGVITSVPLIWFVNAAKRLNYGTVGFLTYITPSLTFIAAVVIYNEPLNTTKLISFCFIWVALIMYTIDSLAHEKRLRRAAVTPLSK